MLNLSVDQGQLISGLIARHGLAGMWVFWSGWLSIFVVPIVFAPLWKKLNFKTDNEFLLFRYPGKAGQVLHAFRSVYVGFLVVSLSISFHLLGFSRILEVYFDLSQTASVFLSGIVLACFALKNVLDLKIKTDSFHALTYLLSFILVFLVVLKAANGWNGIFNYFELHPEKKTVFPSKDSSSQFSFLVILLVQWWSVYLFDGGGAETSRFIAVDESKNVVRAALFPVFIAFIKGLMMVILVLFILGMNQTSENPELNFIERIFQLVPKEINGIVLIGFLGVFISTSESLLNWGASFITVDVYQKYFNKNATEKNERAFAFTLMVLMSFCATFFALSMENLESLVKLTFSIAAGVAPVYILRWVWYKINAWTQLSAMIASAVFTLFYPYLHSRLPLSQFPMEESRILVVTLLTIMVWILVTLITKSDHEDIIRNKMLSVIESKAIFVKRFLLAMLLGLLFLIVVISIYTFLFK